MLMFVACCLAGGGDGGCDGGGGLQGKKKLVIYGPDDTHNLSPTGKVNRINEVGPMAATAAAITIAAAATFVT